MKSRHQFADVTRKWWLEGCVRGGRTLCWVGGVVLGEVSGGGRTTIVGCLP